MGRIEKYKKWLVVVVDKYGVGVHGGKWILDIGFDLCASGERRTR